jgi:hypothetical protein
LSIKELKPRQGDNGLWGYVTESGDWYIKPAYREARNFSDQRAAVKPKGGEQWGFIDTAGNLVIAAKFSYVQDFEEGSAIVSLQDKSGVINVNDQFLIQPNWNSIYRKTATVFNVTELVRKFSRPKSVKLHCSRGEGPAIDEKTIQLPQSVSIYRKGELDINNSWIVPLTEYESEGRISLDGTKYKGFCSII